MSIRPFVDTLRDLECGVFLESLGSEQHELIQAIQKTNKGGKLVIELDYKPEGNGQMTIAAAVKSKVPQMPRGKSLFFVTPEANLTRTDPRQQEIPGLRSVDTDTPEFREVKNG